MSDPPPYEPRVVSPKPRPRRESAAGRAEVLGALHRFYVDTLPAAERSQVQPLTEHNGNRLDLDFAIATLLYRREDIPRLTMWHLIASALLRDPSQLGAAPDGANRDRLPQIARLMGVPENQVEAVAGALVAFAANARSAEQRPDAEPEPEEGS